MPELQIERVHSVSRSFCRHHRVHAPRTSEALSLGQPLEPGGFGTPYPVAPTPGASRGPDLMVKVFHANAEVEAHVRRLTGRLHAVLADRRDATWPDRLLALPFLLAQARFEGSTRLIALMLDLRSLGYQSYSFEEEEAIDYQLRSDLDRLEFAYQFACGARLLESISFVHADLNFKNLLFNEQTGDVQILDFDSGALVESGDERPITVGAADDFVPPEVKGGPLDPPADESLYTAEAERWSIGTMMGMLLFGVGPLLFIAEFSKAALDAYAASTARTGNWPEVDTSSAFFFEQNRASYEYWKPVFENAPGQTRERFAEFAAAGSNGASRPTAAAWAEALEDERRPPSFEFLRAEPDVLVEGTEVLISWRVKGADGVESKLFGSLEPEGSETFVVGQATRFEITASNRYGTVSEVTNPVRVVPLPRMERVPIPAFPDFRMQVKVPAAIPSPPLPPPAPLRLASSPFPAPLPRALTPVMPGALQLPALPSILGLFPGRRGGGRNGKGV